MSPEAQQLCRDGYVVLPALYAPDRLTVFRDALESIRAELGDPPLYARTPLRPVPNMEISSTGLVFLELLGWRPELAPLLLHEGALGVVREVLGASARLELVGGVMTDETRPFFEWHNHVGGPDDEAVRLRGASGSSSPTPSRLSYLVYLEDVTEETGPLLFHPERTSEPPEPRDRARWCGDVVVTLPAGSVVLIEEHTWHAVPQRSTPGRRHWVGAYFAAAHLPPPTRRDSSLLHVGDALVRSLVAPEL